MNSTKKHDRNHPGRPDENDILSSNLLVSCWWCWCCWRRENGSLPAKSAHLLVLGVVPVWKLNRWAMLKPKIRNRILAEVIRRKLKNRLILGRTTFLKIKTILFYLVLGSNVFLFDFSIFKRIFSIVSTLTPCGSLSDACFKKYATWDASSFKIKDWD